MADVADEMLAAYLIGRRQTKDEIEDLKNQIERLRKIEAEKDETIRYLLRERSFLRDVLKTLERPGGK